MASDNLTFEIDGEVHLEDLTDSLARFQRLIDALTEEVSKKAGIAWVVDDLRPGSAVATIRGVAVDMEAVARVVHAYGAVGQALHRGHPIPYSEKVRKAAQEIMSVLGGNVVSVRFETPDEEWAVVTPGGEAEGQYPPVCVRGDRGPN